MLANGWIDEVEKLRSDGYGDWPPMKSVGYKEVQLFLDGEIERADLNDRIVTATMQLIKKQQTWFKRDPEIQWFTPEDLDKAKQWTLSKVSN